MSKKIKAAIFDVDGVILDSMSTLNTMPIRYLATIGIEAEPNLGEILFSETFETGAEYMIKKYNLDITVKELLENIIKYQEYSYINEMEVKPYVKETLEYLKQSGIPMVIATSNERHFCEGAMQKHGLLDYFQGIVTSPEIGNTKDKPDIFYEAIKILGQSKENTVLFEDGIHAIITAKEIGLPVIGVYDEESSQYQDDIKHLADQYVMNLGEWLDSPVAQHLEL